MNRTPKKPRFGWKQALFTLHLWLGLASGLLFTLVCLTGFYLAVHPPLEEWLNRDLLTRPQAGPSLSADQIMEIGLTGSTASLTEVEIPAGEGGAWRVRGKDQSLYIDPYSGAKLGDLRPLLGDSYNTIKRLHRWLLLDRDVGRPITGAAALIYLVILLSGAVLWLNKCYKNLSRGLSFRRGVGWKRAAYDAHLVLGIYALLPLFLMALTGLYWSYREPYKAIVYRLLDGAPAPPPAPAKKDEDEQPRQSQLPYSLILGVTNSTFPSPGMVEIVFPKQGETTVKVAKVRQAGFWHLPIKDELVFDARDGRLVASKPFAEKTRAQQILSLMFAIHTGAAWGNLSLLLYLAAVMVGASLPITGTVMWCNRMQGQRKSRQILARRREVETSTLSPEG